MRYYYLDNMADNTLFMGLLKKRGRNMNEEEIKDAYKKLLSATETCISLIEKLNIELRYKLMRIEFDKQYKEWEKKQEGQKKKISANGHRA